MILNTNLTDGMPLFKAFSSPVRVSIYRLISQNLGISPGNISSTLQIPPSTLAPHLKILCEADLIQIVDIQTATAQQKGCFLKTEFKNLSIDFTNSHSSMPGIYHASVPVGYYNDYSIAAPCAMASAFRFLGALDDPRYFSQLSRTEADIIWFTTGYLEYSLPNLIPQKSRIISLSFTFEISSEAPEYNNNWPSDIEFSLNGTILGTWISPGDYGGRPGKMNPHWWHSFLNQYGLLKKLTINSEGTFIDDEKLSDITIQALNLTTQSPVKLRFSVHPDASHPGGCTIFGKSFGDHPVDIEEEIVYVSE